MPEITLILSWLLFYHQRIWFDKTKLLKEIKCLSMLFQLPGNSLVQPPLAMDTPICSYWIVFLSSVDCALGQNNGAPWSQKHASSMLCLRTVQNWLLFNWNVLSSRYCCQSVSHVECCVSVDSSARPNIERNPFMLLQFCWPQAAVVQSRFCGMTAVEVPGGGKQTVRTFMDSTNGSVTKISWTESGSLDWSERTCAMSRSWDGWSSSVVPKSHSPARTISISIAWCLLVAVNTTAGWINEPAPLYNSVCLREFWFNFRKIATVQGNSPVQQLTLALSFMYVACMFRTETENSYFAYLLLFDRMIKIRGLACSNPFDLVCRIFWTPIPVQNSHLVRVHLHHF